MSFVNLWFLFALVAVAVPVIIHLFQFRRFQRVFFSNIYFLEELNEEKRKQSKLKHLLVLLSRILAVIFLVLAFARPYLPHDEAEISLEGNSVSIYIDNSFSMEALSAQGRMFDEAKFIAIDIAETFAATDDFHLLTNDFEGKHQRFVSREDFTSLLEEVELSPLVRDLSQIYQRQKEMLYNSSYKNKSIFIISDFQKNITDLENFAYDTLISTFLIPLSAQRTDNLFIDSLWFESPVNIDGQPVTVNIRIQNEGKQKLQNQPLRLFVNDVLRAVASFDILPGETLVKQLSFTASGNGVQQGWAEIVDYPVIFDDKKYFSLQITENIPVPIINQSNENRYLNALYDGDDTFDYRNMYLLNIDYSAFQNTDIIVLNGLNSISSGLHNELKRFLNEGGSIAVFPGEAIDFDSYRSFLSDLNVNFYTSLDTNNYEVSSLNVLHPLFYGVFDDRPENVVLPDVDKHYVINRDVSVNEDYLLQLQNGNNLFSSYQSGSGQVYLSAVPLNVEFSNFPLHPLFVPTLYNVALYSVPQTKPYEVIGSNLPVRARHRAEFNNPVYHLRAEGLEIIPEARMAYNRVNLYVHDQVKKAGNYRLFSGESFVDGISFNYDRHESKMEFYDVKKLDNEIDDHQLSRINTINIENVSFDKAFERFAIGRELWQLCLLLALLFLLCEVVLLRFWK